MAGKSINLFLMDGDPNGRIKCSLANWTGVAYKIPRTMLDKARNIEALKQTGVYLLFGADPTTDEPVVYIGQAAVRKNGMGILNRWEEHKRDTDKDWWNEAVALTTRDNSFGQTEIAYLENRFRNMALDAGRYRVMNGNEPAQGNITEEKECEMDEFISNARLIIGTLGYKVFDSLLGNRRVVEVVEAPDDGPIFTFHYGKVEARGTRTAEGFVVMAGSHICPTTTKSVPDNVIKNREKYAPALTADGVLTKDLLFTSPSAAAGFVGGASLSGNVTWRLPDGRTLKQLDGQG
ncbi:MAG: GIY-YIG nuclease family protein [Trueperella sp.]|uniref:GIY-YIG nuclease family protein n=1 Tax=Trueperella sp. TaxID=2699835 RepID=UPI0025F4C929|nr:GIY-YIG nuclease family protein [Trueperella sp.]MCI7305705.1 GIY-YIG nuclease family protein [Trueperella sp.]